MNESPMRHALVAAILLPAAGLVLAGGVASAADMAELERIRDAIAEAIKEPIGGPDGARVTLAEPIGAAWQDGRAVISLKGAQVVTPINATIAVGNVDIAVLPRNDGYYDFSVTMPKSFAISGGPSDKATLSFADYRFAGTWSREIENVANIDVMFDDLVLTNETSEPREKFRISVGDLAARTNYTKGANGLWSGTANGLLSGFVVDAPEGEGDFELGSIEMSSTSQGIDVDNWSRLARRITEATKPGSPPLTDAQRQEFATALAGVNWGVNDASMVIRGIAFTEDGKRVFSLGNSTFKLGFDGSREAGQLGLRFSIADLLIEENMLPPNLAPTKGALDVSLEQFPLRAFLGSMFLQGAEGAGMMPEPSYVPLPEPALIEPPAAAEPASETAAANPETPTDPNRLAETSPAASIEGSAPRAIEGETPPVSADAGTATEVPPAAEPAPMTEPPMIGPFRADDPFIQRIFELGTQIVLNEFSIDAPGTGVSASGRVRVDPESAGMGVGKLKASLRGIDAVLAYVNDQARHDEEMKAIAAFLIFLKGLGRAEAASAGETVYVYDIDVPKDGPPTVNGTPLDQMDFD
jgi:hypothetical protein